MVPVVSQHGAEPTLQVLSHCKRRLHMLATVQRSSVEAKTPQGLCGAP